MREHWTTAPESVRARIAHYLSAENFRTFGVKQAASCGYRIDVADVPTPAHDALTAIPTDRARADYRQSRSDVLRDEREARELVAAYERAGLFAGTKADDDTAKREAAELAKREANITRRAEELRQAAAARDAEKYRRQAEKEIDSR